MLAASCRVSLPESSPKFAASNPALRNVQSIFR